MNEFDATQHCASDGERRATNAEDREEAELSESHTKCGKSNQVRARKRKTSRTVWLTRRKRYAALSRYCLKIFFEWVLSQDALSHDDSCMLRWIVKLGQVDIGIEVSTTSSKMSHHDLPSVDYDKLKHQDWSRLIVAQVFVDADRAGVQMEYEDMHVEFWNVCHERLPDQHVGNQNMCHERLLIKRGIWSEHLTSLQLRASERARGTEFVTVELLEW